MARIVPPIDPALRDMKAVPSPGLCECTVCKSRRHGSRDSRRQLTDYQIFTREMENRIVETLAVNLVDYADAPFNMNMDSFGRTLRFLNVSNFKTVVMPARRFTDVATYLKAREEKLPWKTHKYLDLNPGVGIDLCLTPADYWRGAHTQILGLGDGAVTTDKIRDGGISRARLSNPDPAEDMYDALSATWMQLQAQARMAEVNPLVVLSNGHSKFITNNEGRE